MYESSSDEEGEAPTLIAFEPESAVATRAAESEVISQPAKDSLAAPCPVTILSGFLGAGKTSLIRYILNSPDHGKRIAVIENEFGNAEGLQVESIIARDGMDDSSLSDFIELPNGCICCTVKDSLVVTLEKLLEKRSDLDYILIECSGMANPGPIASLFWLDDALESRLRLDGVVTLVDAANIERQLKDTVEASQQIAYADRIILNKVDLLQDKGGSSNADSEIERIRKLIRTIHPTAATIKTTTYSMIPDLDWILDARCFDADRAQDILEQHKLIFEEDDVHSHSHDHAGDDDCEICVASTKDHSHTAAVSTVSLTVNGTVDISKVNKWLASILWPNQDEKDQVLRAMLENSDMDGISDGAKTQSDHVKESTVKPTHQQIFRIKGILSVRHAPESDEMLNLSSNNELIDADGVDRRRFIVQAVHDLWDIHPSSSIDLQWNSAEDRCSKLIVIGRYLQVSELQDGFEACRVPELPCAPD